METVDCDNPNCLQIEAFFVPSFNALTTATLSFTDNAISFDMSALAMKCETDYGWARCTKHLTERNRGSMMPTYLRKSVKNAPYYGWYYGLIPSKSEDSESNDVKCKMDMIVSRKTMQVMQALASTEVIGKHIGQVDFE
ncbi:hypothetical protein T11_7476 [Trichinella zimbabwensis]|uniref:Uncharacterized protein n=1 Tax=Trichinella zimbabwensis TaxID=268475 RepID=A0A0V1GVX0_9BILA|nr:hypothetical protein T11_7476 [Trichinella zimbabwensis]